MLAGNKHSYGSHVCGALGLALCVIAGFLWLGPATSEARTIGANMNRPANVDYGCEWSPHVDGPGFRTFIFTGAQSCTYLPVGAVGNFSETTIAPGNGVLRRARVKVGNITGPMQFTIVSASENVVSGFACCVYTLRSRVFTPRRNAVTTVALNLPVRDMVTRGFGRTIDRLGITVLAPGVPIPAQDVMPYMSGIPHQLNMPSSIAWTPHFSPGQIRVDGGGVAGVQPLINADFEPFCGRSGRSGPGGRIPARTSRCIQPLRASNPRLRNRVARLRLTCNMATRCKGRLRLRGPMRKGAKKRILAKRGVTVAAGRSKQFKIRFNKQGRRAVKGSKRVKVQMRIGLAGQPRQQAITLRR